MFVTLNWLREFVPIEVSTAKLNDMLTMTGLEIETVEDIKPEFDKVVVGKILRISPHPNADKLVLCDVETGEASPLRMVCGAKNMKDGDTVAVALVGAGLAGGIKVKKAKIRGETSVGMMCSERELGLGDDHSGIMILPPDTPVGKAVEEVLGLDDVVLDLGITPNRPDCLSIFGVAREVGAITRSSAKPPQVSMQETDEDIASLTSITIDDDSGCPRYAARIVSNVKIGPSPAWMQQRLLRVGLRPLNNVVDVTNYVLMELGHPLHAFDYHKLDENRIVVRRARGGESIVTLDGIERELTEQMLVIADAEKPVAIAGVMGGANSEVTEQTTTVLIESAYFDPVSIRRTSKALGLSTEASYRFERGADFEMVTLALDRTAALMAELGGGEIAGGLIDQYPRKFSPVEIKLRYQRIGKILGIEIPSDEAISILAALGFEIISEETDGVHVRVPSYRPDVQAEIDLIEEAARIYGYDRIKATYPQDSTVTARGVQSCSSEDQYRNILKGCGFSEILTFSFGSPAAMADLAGDDFPPAIRMKNPLTEDTSALRTTLIPGLLQSLQANAKVGNKDLKLFEIGNVYLDEGEALPNERTLVAGVMTGLSHQMSWRGRPADVDFFDIKGVTETLLAASGYPAVEAVKASLPGFHPGACAEIALNGITVGKMGEIHPSLLEKYEIGQKVCVFEVDLTTLESQPAAERKYEKISRYPYSDRDLAVVVGEQLAAASLSSAITEAGGEILRRVFLFDTYRGKQVADGKKSLAFSLRFQSDERTLTDEEITTALTRVIHALEEKFGARLRA